MSLWFEGNPFKHWKHLWLNCPHLTLTEPLNLEKCDQLNRSELILTRGERLSCPSHDMACRCVSLEPDYNTLSPGAYEPASLWACEPTSLWAYKPTLRAYSVFVPQKENSVAMTFFKHLVSYERGPLKSFKATINNVPNWFFSSPLNIPSPSNIPINRLPILRYWLSLNKILGNIKI